MKQTPPRQVEKANSADYQEIVEVWEASVRATHDFLSEEDIRYFRPLILNEYLKTVDLFCIRSEQGRIEGYLGTSADKIEMLFLRPETRGKGIGRALLHYAIHTLAITKVEVNEQNGQAVGFYEHMGFRVVGRSALDGTGKPYPILRMELKNYQ